MGLTWGEAQAIAVFTVSFSLLHYNVISHVCEAISGYFVLLTLNCLASTLDYIVMQMRKTNREKGYYKVQDSAEEGHCCGRAPQMGFIRIHDNNYYQFSFRISRVLTNIYFLWIVLNRAKISLY